MEVLIVGAGAVGRVYGHHLARGGARVSVRVREHGVAEAEAGYTLYRIRRRRARKPVVFRPDGIMTRADQVAARRFDQIWLCVPSDALEGEWVGELLAASGDALIVYLQPGMHVAGRMQAQVPADRLVSGAIALASYPAPLPGEEVPRPGTAYLFPPGSKTRFSGPRAREAAEALERGGAPARVDADARAFLSATSAVIQPLMVALEGAGWRFAQLRGSPLLGLGLRAAREALAVAAREVGFRPPWWRALLRPWLGRLALRLIPRLAPFPVEAYLELHFTKVKSQTRLNFPAYGRAADALDLPAEALRELEARVLTRPAAEGGGRRSERRPRAR